MSAKRQIVEALDTLPESLSVEEALERLLQAFRLKRALAGVQASAGSAKGPAARGARILRLVEAERIDQARELAAHDDAPEWQRVLAPAVVKVAENASGQGITDQADAARGRLDQYPGQWVVP